MAEDIKPEQADANAAAQASVKPKLAPKKPKKSKGRGQPKRTRITRPYPAWSFEASLALGSAIHQYASGEKVRRLTLLKQINRSPTGSSTQNLITNSAKYSITTGSYSADHLALTPVGFVACDPQSVAHEQLQARFLLAIEGIRPFKKLYDDFKGKRLPSHDVLQDALLELGERLDNPKECIDIFIVNAKFLGLLQTISGTETLVPIEQVLEELGPLYPLVIDGQAVAAQPLSGKRSDFSNVCFYIAPIGEEGSEERKHSDLFLSQIIEPALAGFNLRVLRADQIGEPGLITSQVIEYLMCAKLCVVDMSFHNPSVFYEMAIRHACMLPIVQISRKADRLPFDVNQVRTVVIDTTDIYTLIPKLETYRSEVTMQVKAALEQNGLGGNPISVFMPGFRAAGAPPKTK